MDVKLPVALALLSFAGLLRADRVERSLSGAGWTCDGEAVTVPHTWNAIDGADGARCIQPRGTSCAARSYLRKAATYVRDLPDPTPGKRQFIRFGGVSIRATVRVNGVEAGRHAGAFTAFCFEVTPFLRPTGNRLEVVADNRRNLDVPPVAGDFTLYGGVYRDVTWLETDATCIDPCVDGGPGVEVSADARGRVSVRAHVRGDAARARLSYEICGRRYDTSSFSVPDVRPWTPETPNLHELKVILEADGARDCVVQRIGFRDVEFRADGFYLNGVRRKLRGICRHQDRDGKGWAVSAEDEREDMDWIKRMGADSVRSAHYPQSRSWYDLCDERGLLVWCEAPLVNELVLTEAFKSNATVAVREMVAQNRNHPSVFCWGLFNELYSASKCPRGSFEPFLSELRDGIAAQDPTRGVTAASNQLGMRSLNAVPGNIAFNVYPGWYSTSLDGVEWYRRDIRFGDGSMANLLSALRQANGLSALGVGEYGAGAVSGVRGDFLREPPETETFHTYSEDYQAGVHHENYLDIVRDRTVWGSFVWEMFDSGSDVRSDPDRNGINNKGLVTFDRTTPKAAYWFYKANWNPEPMLFGLPGTPDADGRMTVVAFCNTGKPVTLTVNGVSYGAREPDEVRTAVWTGVPSAGRGDRVVFSSGDLTDVREGADGPVVLRPGAVEVVRDWRACSTVRFAADEMTNFLSRALGGPVPLVYAPTGGRTVSVVVGTNAWSRAAGVRPELLARDGYVVRAESNRVYVAGCDDPSVDMKALLAARKHWAFFNGERATVFAVYDFLDRFAGVRFYFPGEFGTVVPARSEIRVPPGVTTREPDSAVREFHQEVQPLSYLRLGGQSKYTPCAHGLVGLNLQERFGQAHPEWFALMRDLDGVNRRMTQFRTPWFEKWQSPCFCLSNADLWEQIHDDAVAYLSGVSAKDRGVPNYWADNKGWAWGHGCWYNEFVDVMPEDGMRPCLCPNCQAAYAKDAAGRLVEEYATELVWGRTAELGRRFLKEGVKGFLTQMAYSPYRALPSCDLPTNVLVMVAVNGPWTEGDRERRDVEDGIVRAWTGKAPGRVWLWTYPAKFALLNWPGVPQMTPKSFAAYLQRHLPNLRGMKFEAHTDKPIYNYLNDYVASKLFWDHRTDVNELLAEHDAVMFGAAAGEMRGFYDLLEYKWIAEIASRAGGNGTGGIRRVPVSVAELWTKVYSPDVLEKCRGFFARAEKAVRPGSPQAERVAFIRREFLEPLEAAAKRWAESADLKREFARRAQAKGANLLGEPSSGDFRMVSAEAQPLVPDGALGGLPVLRFAAKERTYAVRDLGALLKPATRYRVSAFLKCKDVETFSGYDGGLNLEFTDGVTTARHPFPDGHHGVGYLGTMDWATCSFEFTTAATLGKDRHVAVRLANASGTAWFAGLRVEEVEK